jgi:2-polyprenyl-3-methyl-5-hydroxy-6-metoxy-1,4-benzoquinol methylase
MEVNLKKRATRLSEFYGRVAETQNKSIIKLITGNKVLDVGCGYGHLANQLQRAGYKVAGIDADASSFEIAKKLYNVEIQINNLYESQIPDASFDTVVFRESIHHFIPIKALREACRICNREIIIFDPNPTWILKVARKLIKHYDSVFNPYDIRKLLEALNFKIEYCGYRDVIAFPLSGGFVGRQLVPRIKVIENIILLFDMIINLFLEFMGLQFLFCWRYIIKAEKV